MDFTLPAELKKQVEQELASGLYQSPDELIEHAVRHFLDERHRGQRRLDPLGESARPSIRRACMSECWFLARNDVNARGSAPIRGLPDGSSMAAAECAPDRETEHEPAVAQRHRRVHYAGGAFIGGSVGE